ncbi:hypothetical protein ABID82_006535, partial [Methylobacterium sp. PvP062]
MRGSDRPMTALDPAEIFRAEAAELLACLETTL